MRLIIWNTHVGHRGREALQAQALRSVDADLAVLVEVVEGAGHAALFSRAWRHHAFARARRRAGGGRQGTLILSKQPLHVLGRWDLSNHRLERRVALCVSLPGGLHLVALHLDLTGLGRRLQWEKLESRMEGVLPDGAPLLLAGDCNDGSASLERRLAARGFQEAHRAVHGRSARTFPSRAPLLALDRIYGRGVAFTKATRLSGEPWRGLSDHLPLVAELGGGAADGSDFSCSSSVRKRPKME
ncbi:MAG: endonuclease/exonuclease/phosphatase family protein [Spirochaetes bacterium]|nr:endonuclease/exonuclease/phosphatase family protein [Spirochaetota bacterium]